MNKLRLLFWSSSLLLVCAACGRKAQSGNDYGQSLQQLPVIEVEKQDLLSNNYYPVSIEGTQNISIRAKVDGYIKEVFVDEGDWVKKGSLLFRIETRLLKQNAKAAKAAVDLARLEIKKLKPLVENNIVSEVQLETAEARFEQALSNYNSIIENIKYSDIKSPVDGIVGTIKYRKGTLVSPSMQDALTQVSNINNIYGFFSINEKEFITFMDKTPGNTSIEKINNFPDVELILADGSKYKYSGRLQTISGQVDKSTGAITFRASFPNPEKILRDGNSGKIGIPKNYSNKVVIPHQCTFEIQGKYHVYVLTPSNNIMAQVIEVEDKIGRYLVVNKGLEEGQKILAKGLNKVQSGMAIQPQITTSEEIIKSFETKFK